ncbi:hypothetical protein [Tropicibacter oceani]|uniref:Uncharacterized protein n=1 Tax=Tropicibacter oceani TaxID=3058420 RepID=A0ABY8QG72_9RHOB|nr:hypothetical protein [Tropicibacter oceani]WGW03433.1 hypothetical protein QF118_16115 [Tropicibacter oceani]
MPFNKTGNTADGSSNVQQAGGDIHIQGVPAEQHTELVRALIEQHERDKEQLRQDLEAKHEGVIRAYAIEVDFLRLQILYLGGGRQTDFRSTLLKEPQNGGKENG